MPQSLLALLGVMLVTLMSTNHHRIVLESYESLVREEVELMAGGVATQVGQFIGQRAFDAAVREGRAAGTGDLTQGPFPGGARCDLVAPIKRNGSWDDCLDIEDFHLMQPQQVPFRAGEHEVLFEVTAEVRYVDDVLNPSATPTNNKEVIVVVAYVPPADGVQFTLTPVRLSRVFSHSF